MAINNIPDENDRIIKNPGGVNGRFTVNYAEVRPVRYRRFL